MIKIIFLKHEISINLPTPENYSYNKICTFKIAKNSIPHVPLASETLCCCSCLRYRQMLITCSLKVETDSHCSARVSAILGSFP